MGLETSVTSESVTIDMTHPIVNRDKLLVFGRFLNAENSIRIVYINGVFVDPESGRLRLENAISIIEIQNLLHAIW